VRPERLSFFNEQRGVDALALVRRSGVVETLRALRARVTMGLVDVSDERAEAVKVLGAAGVPVDMWVLLDRADGYFATPDNADRVEARVGALLDWSRRHELKFTSLGFDFEPDLRDLDSFFARPVRTLGHWAWRARDRERLARAAGQYGVLIRRLQGQGFEVETYQFPLLLEDRAAGSRFFQRLISSLDVPVEREVLMVYSSLLGALGEGLAESWTRSARSVAVGSTGGGIDPMPKVSFDELVRDLRWASRVASDVRIFSLEGCVEHDFLTRLVDLDWGAVSVPSTAQRWGAASMRTSAQWLAWLMR
jgi:hypothetical protein